jgi:hypothetical protein
MTLELTGPQYRLLGEALRARLRLSQFDQLLKQRLDINREDIALGEDYTDITFRVIQAVNQRGWVYKLVDAARQERPNEAVFVEYAALLGIGPRGLPDGAELERIVKKTNALLDIATFRSRIGEIEGRVCRVDIKNEGEGTGFLVAPNVVLTNYHVVEDLEKEKYGVEDFTCRFDYKVNYKDIKVGEGITVQVEKLLTYSSYDAVADLKDGSQEPNPDYLDYALLLLKGKPGNDPLGGKMVDSETPPRGWISLPDKPYGFAANSPLFIVQHPATKPMKLGLDTEAVIGLNGNGTRVKYRTNTERGSSGSPCFNQNWELVALHHAGDPKYALHYDPQWNRGIPIALITEHIKKTGFGQYIQITS